MFEGSHSFLNFLLSAAQKKVAKKNPPPPSRSSAGPHQPWRRISRPVYMIIDS